MENGTQIDLLINRNGNDDAITICEIKYTSTPFNVDKQYAQNITNKIDIFRTVTKTTKQIFLAFMSVSGIKKSERAAQLISTVVTLDALF